MENREPFKLILKVLKFHGLWEPEKLSPRHKISLVISTIIILIFVALIHLFALQVETSADLAQLLVVAPGYILIIVNSASFFIKRDKFKALMADLGVKMDADPAAFTFIDRAYRISKGLTHCKFVMVVITAIGGCVVPLVVHELTIKIWLPLSWKHREDVFYCLWIFESVTTAFYGPLYLALQELFWTL